MVYKLCKLTFATILGMMLFSSGFKPMPEFFYTLVERYNNSARIYIAETEKKEYSKAKEEFLDQFSDMKKYRIEYLGSAGIPDSAKKRNPGSSNETSAYSIEVNGPDNVNQYNMFIRSYNGAEIIIIESRTFERRLYVINGSDIRKIDEDDATFFGSIKETLEPAPRNMTGLENLHNVATSKKSSENKKLSEYLRSLEERAYEEMIRRFSEHSRKTEHKTF